MVQSAQIEMLRQMVFIREFEQALSARKDHGFQLLSTGEEAVAVGICSALRPGDQLLTGGRSIGPALARGADPNRVMAELLEGLQEPIREKAAVGIWRIRNPAFLELTRLLVVI